MEYISTIIISILLGLLYILNQSMFKKLGSNLADLATKEELTDIEESIRNTYRKDVEKYKVKFNYLHLEKSKVIHEVFYNIKYTHGHLNHYIKTFSHNKKDKIEIEKSSEKTHNALQTLNNHFAISSLYLSKSNCRIIETIIDDLRTIYKKTKSEVVNYNIKISTANQIDQEIKKIRIIVKNDIDTKIEDLENIFREELL